MMAQVRWNPGTGAPRAVVGSMVHIPKTLVNMDRLRAELTVKNDVYWQTLSVGGDTSKIQPVFELWTETEDIVSVPRHYIRQRATSKPLFLDRCDSYVDVRSTAPRVRGINHVIKLRDGQEEANQALLKDENDKIVSLACGKGKALPLTEKVLTPRGWSTMGDLRVGMKVVGVDGKPTEVIGVFPQGELEVFRVVFDDGASVECSGDHLWLTQTPNDRYRGSKGEVRTLHEIRRTLFTKAGAQHSILRCGEVDSGEPYSKLPIDPWLLGFYLGNGSSGVYAKASRRLTFDSPHKELHERIATLVDHPVRCVKDPRSKNISTIVKFGRGKSLLWEALTMMSLVGVPSYKKQVPSVVMSLSPSDRRLFLRGILEADGHRYKTGHEFCTTSKKMALSIRELAESLGARVGWEKRVTSYRYKEEKRKGRPSYRLRITKLEWLGHQKGRYERRYVKKVIPVGKKPCVCIKVANADGLFLVNRHIVTHNTVISLHAAAEGNRFPLLVVVHTNALMDQWRANHDDKGKLIGGIKKFYGLEDWEIGHIQGPKCEWRGKKVAIAMLHTLVLKKFEFDFYRYWRLVIFDEVHRLGAQFFQKAASMFYAERWGLSATVEREDGMDRIFRMHLGDVVYEDLEQPLEPEIFFIDTGVQVDMNQFMMWRSNRVNLAKLQTHLAEHDKRNELILAWVRKAYGQGRTILVLGERLSQLHEMTEKLQAEGIDAAVYVGATKKDERKKALRARVIFATQQIAKEGLDKASLDTLFILVPFGGKGRLQQSLGRVLRLLDSKKKPIACIFEDKIGIIAALGRKMRKFIRSFGYEPRQISQHQAWKEVK